jgi:hypothetical protein
VSGRRRLPTDAAILAGIMEQQRLERIRRKGHTESKTFLVPQPVTTAMFIPPFFVGLDDDGETPEWKRLTGFAMILQGGSATVGWSLNGTDLGVDTAVTTTKVFADLTAAGAPVGPVDLGHADAIQPTVSVDDGSAFGLSAAVFMVCAPR